MNLLSQVLAANPANDPIIMLRESGVQVKHSQFLNDVALLCIDLEHCQEMRWILYAQDPYLFVIGFFALLQSKKTIYLPPNSQRGTLLEMAEFSDAIICDENLSGFSCVCVRIRENLQNVPYTFDNLDTSILEVGLYTSGTTGAPKLVNKKIRQLEEELNTLQTVWGKDISGAMVFSTVSHQHIYGLLFKILWPLVLRSTIVAKIFQYPEELVHELKKAKQAVLISSPVHLDAIVQREEASQIKGHISFIFSSAGPLSASTSLAMRDKSGIDVTEVLGSTETGGVAFRRRIAGSNNELWTPFPCVQVSCNADQVLMVKSPHAGTSDWFLMGDTAEINAEGCFMLKKRIDRIVKVSGKRLSLDEMESRLKAINTVQDAYVLTIEGQRRVVVAVLVLNEQGQQRLLDNNKNEMIKELKAELLKYYEIVLLPKKWRFVESFPRNTQGKILYAEMSGLFANG